jgi:hypothetical protein
VEIGCAAAADDIRYAHVRHVHADQERAGARRAAARPASRPAARPLLTVRSAGPAREGCHRSVTAVSSEDTVRQATYAAHRAVALRWHPSRQSRQEYLAGAQRRPLTEPRGHCCIEQSDIFSAASPSKTPGGTSTRPGAASTPSDRFGEYALANRCEWISQEALRRVILATSQRNSAVQCPVTNVRMASTLSGRPYALTISSGGPSVWGAA